MKKINTSMLSIVSSNGDIKSERKHMKYQLPTKYMLERGQLPPPPKKTLTIQTRGVSLCEHSSMHSCFKTKMFEIQ